MGSGNPTVRLTVLAALLLGVLLFLVGFISYSSSPGFCRSCHNMEPYYQSWKESRHSEVTCTECHFKPGLAGTLRGKFEASALVVKYLTGTYQPKPFARIEDDSCLQPGCHVKEKLGDAPLFKGKATFTHQPHFRDDLQSNLTCTACHSPLKSGKHISVNEKSCYLCHLRGFDSSLAASENNDEECMVCHKSIPEVIHLGRRNIVHEDVANKQTNCYECHSNVVKGSGSVSLSVCYNCHNWQEEIPVEGRRGRKLHNIHVKNHQECFQCHTDINHGIDREAKVAGSDCRSCHLAKHSGVRMLYSGTGGRDVPDRPGPMFQAGVDCIGCHALAEPPMHESFKGLTRKAIKKRCMDCHKNDTRYGEIMDIWKEKVDERVAVVGKKIKMAEKKFGESPKSEELSRSLNNARYNYFFVKDSPGIHNVGYSLALLEAAENRLNQALGLESAPAEMPPMDEDEDYFLFTDTEGLPPALFNHSMHQSIYPDCEDCHDKFFEMEFGSSDALGLMTMSNMIQGKYCGGCHNGEEATSVKEACDMCHVERDKK